MIHMQLGSSEQGPFVLLLGVRKKQLFQLFSSWIGKRNETKKELLIVGITWNTTVVLKKQSSIEMLDQLFVISWIEFSIGMKRKCIVMGFFFEDFIYFLILKKINEKIRQRKLTYVTKYCL